jgi:hypothetical protein
LPDDPANGVAGACTTIKNRNRIILFQRTYRRLCLPSWRRSLSRSLWESSRCWGYIRERRQCTFSPSAGALVCNRSIALGIRCPVSAPAMSQMTATEYQGLGGKAAPKPRPSLRVPPRFSQHTDATPHLHGNALRLGATAFHRPISRRQICDASRRTRRDATARGAA